MTRNELASALARAGVAEKQRRMRAGQLWHWIYHRGATTFAAGGGITAASDPAAEHAESLHKAEGMLRVLAGLDGGHEAAGKGAAP